MSEDASDRQAGGQSRPSPAQPVVLDTRSLFGERREVILVHNGEHYRLRQTQNGKLILTK